MSKNNIVAVKNRADILKLIHFCYQCGKNPTSKEDSGYYINCDSCKKKVAEKLRIKRKLPKIDRNDDLYKLIDKETDGVLTKCRNLNNEYTARWQKEHPERNKIINLIWYNKNKERVKKYQKEWRLKKAERLSAESKMIVDAKEYLLSGEN